MNKIIGGDICPKCGSDKTMSFKNTAVSYYSRRMQACACGAVWEPITPAQLSDPENHLSCLKAPCENCAFRDGSPERSDPDQWEHLLQQVMLNGSTFFCHKGVPIRVDETELNVGFEYPEDPKKLRVCRGYADFMANPAARLSEYLDSHSASKSDEK